MEFLHNDSFTYIILPLLIFLARICDVTIGTLRIIFLSKGKKYIAPIMGFFEVLIWIMAMGQIMENLDNIVCYIAYAGGFATGNFIGMLIEEKLAMGIVGIRVITKKEAHDLVAKLREDGFGITVVDAEGATGQVAIIYTTIDRKDLPGVLNTIKEYNPNAFYTVEDHRFVGKGVFPIHKQKKVFGSFRSVRKSK
ncbi:MAG: hypothetical protein A2W91_03365 [Bacteroidetes bacterium GWF2_38_335]|nr:MAG: hypothetical protein A2W91_03365 [Bacteroidetes bacterium GWF2_38_335]OFY77475.1 MAG: hypothetical protein A2281_01395 [Bacteroidetes bacterium RIFOXYA12_FULL_38_20]HBS87233.1 hypothetical protein [Bacteroidales bacterium]